jgi:hypothetical protein
LEKQWVAFTSGIDFRSRRTDHVWFFYKRELTELKEGARRIKEFSPCRIILKMGGIDIMKRDAILIVYRPALFLAFFLGGYQPRCPSAFHSPYEACHRQNAGCHYQKPPNQVIVHVVSPYT